jgi:hypothetical protein
VCFSVALPQLKQLLKLQTNVSLFVEAFFFAVENFVGALY